MLKVEERDEVIYLRFLDTQNEEDMGVLLRRHRESLMLFLYGFVHNMEDAEELMLDSFGIAASCAAPYSGRSSFKTWLFGIARNRAKMFLRKKRFSLTPLHEVHHPVCETPELDLLREERNRQLYAALDELKPEYRNVLYLMYFEEMKPEEISRILNKNVKQVYNLANRGRTSLRTILEGMGFDHT